MKNDTKERIKVLFLITKSNWGGAQRYVFDLATHLPKDEFEVVVAAGENGALIGRLEAAGIKVIKIVGLQRDISLTQELRASRSILHILRTERPSVLHINSSKAGMFGALLGRVAGVPRIIFTAHGWAFNEDRSYLIRLMFKYFHWLTVLLSHQTITVSNSLQAQMNWFGVQNKMRTIYNGRSIPSFLDREAARVACCEHAPSLRAYRTDLWTGTIAELHPIKGHEVMIEAMAELVAKGHQLRHLIIGAEANDFASAPVTSKTSDDRSERSEAGQGGDGVYTSKLKQLVVKNNLEEHIFFLGHIHEAATLLKAFDIFTLTSHSEALAYTVIEAAQAGLPIVATRVGGIPEIITNEETGILIPPNDPTMLSDRLKSLIANPELHTALSNKAVKRGMDFNLDRMISETTQEYYLLR